MAKTYQKRVKKETLTSTTTTTVPPIETPSFKTMGDVVITQSKSNSHAIKIKTGEKWYKRIWNYATNPFTYILGGKIRY